MTGPKNIKAVQLPAVVRWGNGGILFSFVMIFIGGRIMRLVQQAIPPGGWNAMDGIRWLLLLVAYAPGFIGLLLSFYSVARYPYLSLGTGGGKLMTTPGSWIWILLGTVLFLLSAVLFLATSAHGESLLTQLGLLYLAAVVAFAGFLLCFYRPERHPTIATFLELTFYLGIVLFPFYIPSLVWGSFQIRGNLPTSDSETIEKESW